MTSKIEMVLERLALRSESFHQEDLRLTLREAVSLDRIGLISIELRSGRIDALEKLLDLRHASKLTGGNSPLNQFVAG